MMKRKYLLLISFLILILYTAVPAQAHANLMSSSPEANAQLDTTPIQIELIFSEPIEPALSNITVIDFFGSSVDVGDSTVDPADPTRMTVSLRPLKDGIYTVVWKTLSTVDGHITRGAYPFAIGEVDQTAMDAAAEASQEIEIPIGEVIARWGQYLGIATLVGGSLFLWFVWQPAVESLEAPPSIDESKWQQLGLIALSVFLLANIIFILVQAGQVIGVALAPPWHTAVGNLIFNTRSGILWLGRIGLGIALASYLARPFTSQRLKIIFSLSSMIVLLVSIGSHAAAEADPFWPIFGDFAHGLAASFWVGGLFFFIIALREIRVVSDLERTKLVANLIPRFTEIALSSVVLLSVTGLYSAILRVGSFKNLFQTPYGNMVLFKSILIIPMLIFGAINFKVITPRIREKQQKNQPDAPLVARFTKSVSTEVVIGIVILLGVGLLTSLPPAQDAASVSGFVLEDTTDDLDIVLAITPGQVGLNNYSVTVSKFGDPVIGAREVALTFSPTTEDFPPSEVVLEEQSNALGTYSVRGPYFALADTWQVQVAVRQNNQFDTYFNFELPIGVASTVTFLWYRVGAGFLLLIGLVFLFTWFGLRNRKYRANPILGLALGFGLVLLSGTILNEPPGGKVTVIPVNPIAPNQDSVLLGQELYEIHCQLCHGITGRGDGLVGISLNPPPADLRIHTTPGVHPDGQLFVWISEGFPNSVMPTYEDKLTEEEIWNLVNYIRTFSDE